MYLTLFIVFMALSFILIALGLFRPEHSELSLIGFLFLFLLSMVILYGTVQYKVGTNTTFEYSCFEDCDNQTFSLLKSKEINIDTYENFTGGEGWASHTVGYWLAIMSFIGFVGVLIGLRGGWGK